MLMTKDQPKVKKATESIETTHLVEGQVVRVQNRGHGNLVSQALPGIWVVAFSEMQGCGYVFESELSAV